MRNMIIRRLLISSITLFTLLILYLYPGKNEIISTVNYIDVKYNKIFLLHDNLLVEKEIISNSFDTLDRVKEIIKYLTVNDNKNYSLDKYDSLIPHNTKLISLSLNNGLLKLNFSKDFLNIREDIEEKMIESIVFSLTNLEEIDDIMIFVENEKLDYLPISKKYLPSLLNRNYGINKIYNITTLNNVSFNILYYYINIDNNNDLVPVSIYSNDDINKVEIIIDELKSSPIYQSNLMSFLSDNAKLLDYEILENTIKLEFDNELMDSFYNDKLLEEVKYAISLSLKDSLGYDNVSFFINNNEI